MVLDPGTTGVAELRLWYNTGSGVYLFAAAAAVFIVLAASRGLGIATGNNG